MVKFGYHSLRTKASYDETDIYVVDYAKLKTYCCDDATKAAMFEEVWRDCLRASRESFKSNVNKLLARVYQGIENDANSRGVSAVGALKNFVRNEGQKEEGVAMSGSILRELKLLRGAEVVNREALRKSCKKFDKQSSPDIFALTPVLLPELYSECGTADQLTLWIKTMAKEMKNFDAAEVTFMLNRDHAMTCESMNSIMTEDDMEFESGTSELDDSSIRLKLKAEVQWLRECVKGLEKKEQLVRRIKNKEQTKETRS